MVQNTAWTEALITFALAAFARDRVWPEALITFALAALARALPTFALLTFALAAFAPAPRR